MIQYIKNGHKAALTMNTVEDCEGDPANKIIPLAQYLALEDQNTVAGVWLQAGDEIESMTGNLQSLDVIALDFPSFSDGRAYSSANLLRRVLKFTGELRAIGDVRIDQLEQMARCGFDAFELSENQDVDAAIGRLSGFSFSYQLTVDRDPLFRKQRNQTL